MKSCILCGVDSLKSYCNQCQQDYPKEHYRRNKAQYYARTVAKRKELQNYVWTLKENGLCVDCGLNPHPACMQYDHLPDYEKVDHIPQFIARGSKKKLLTELAKCELVCSNCHSIRTYTRRINHL